MSRKIQLPNVLNTIEKFEYQHSKIDKNYFMSYSYSHKTNKITNVSLFVGHIAIKLFNASK